MYYLKAVSKTDCGAFLVSESPLFSVVIIGLLSSKKLPKSASLQASSQSIPQLFSETLTNLDLVAFMGRRKSLERENGEETWCSFC